jgi:ubiquinone/menaquinone biosynthesis C-methylase UbiE/copper chaperone CopZ
MTEEKSMSKTSSHLVVGLVAFLMGGLSVWSVDHGGRWSGDATTTENQTNDGRTTTASTRAFAIEGMSCQGCADTITSALTQIPGVQSAKVSLQDKRAVVVAKSSAVPTEKILAAITAAGYKGQLACGMPGMSATVTGAKESGHNCELAPYAAEMDKKFADPNADIEPFVKRFESEDRDIYAKRHEIVRSLGLQPGDAVADIGAGTGLFTLLFADQVGPKGVVYAVDIGPAFLKHIAEQVTKQAHEQVITTVLSTQESAMLPDNAIDVAFLCDTYHHFEHPEKMLASIQRALRPNGRLVIIDFDLRKDSSDFIKQRARAPKETYYREIKAAGFTLIDSKEVPVIKENFYAEFRRTEGKK